MGAGPMTQSWDTIRKSVRTLENTLESRLTSYSKLAATASTSYAASGSLGEDARGGYRDLENGLEEGLEKLSSLLDEMKQTLDSPTSPQPPTTAQLHTFQRHQEILSDYRRDFQRTRTSLREAQARSDLLGSVRKEISNSKSGFGEAGDMLLNESNRIESSHRMADDVLGQAYETRYEFQRQRSILQGANARMGGVLSQIPGINSVVGMINSRRRRDNLILGGVIAGCVLFLLWWIFG